MTKPKSRLHETHRGHQIRHRPWRKRHPWYVQVPNPDGVDRWCDVVSLQAGRDL